MKPNKGPWRDEYLPAIYSYLSFLVIYCLAMVSLALIVVKFLQTPLLMVNPAWCQFPAQLQVCMHKKGPVLLGAGKPQNKGKVLENYLNMLASCFLLFRVFPPNQTSNCSENSCGKLIQATYQRQAVTQPHSFVNSASTESWTFPQSVQGRWPCSDPDNTSMFLWLRLISGCHLGGIWGHVLLFDGYLH